MYEMILEVSQQRIDILHEIDGVFEELRRDNKNIESRKKLKENIQKFTGVNDIRIIWKDSYAAWICPIYADSFMLNIQSAIQDKEQDDFEDKTSKYIKTIYVCIGLKLYNLCTAKQLTAILLHEIGHVFLFMGNFTWRIKSISDSIRRVHFKMLNWLFVPFMSLVFMSLAMISRSLNFIEHYQEYKCDQYAAKYGYGTELSNVFKTLSQYEKPNLKLEKSNFFDKILDSIISFLFTKPYPTMEDRMCKILNTSVTKYKELYPSEEKELNVIFSGLKCKK